MKRKTVDTWVTDTRHKPNRGGQPPHNIKGVNIMTDKLNELQRYFEKYATTKTKINNVTINGKPATVTFKEYGAAEKDKEEFKKYDGSDGHYYYIVITTKTEYINTYYGKRLTVNETYVTNKAEGNEIYKQLKETKKFDFTI